MHGRPLVGIARIFVGSVFTTRCFGVASVDPAPVAYPDR